MELLQKYVGLMFRSWYPLVFALVAAFKLIIGYETTLVDTMRENHSAYMFGFVMMSLVSPFMPKLGGGDS